MNMPWGAGFKERPSPSMMILICKVVKEETTKGSPWLGHPRGEKGKAFLGGSNT